MNNFLKRIISSLFLLPIVIYFILEGSYLLLIFISACFFISSYEWCKMVKKNLFKLFGILFLFFSFLSFYKLSFNNYNILFVFLLCVSTDIGGYVFGKILKGPKLTKISPNKTYSGMIGGYALSITTLFVFTLYYGSKSIPFLNLIILIFILSSVSQIGDIIVSYFKRKSNLKNTGSIIPGHGGLLDRIDGMIFTFPIFYIINFNKIIII